MNPLLDKIFSMWVEHSIPLEKALDDCLLAWRTFEFSSRQLPGGQPCHRCGGTTALAPLKVTSTLRGDR